MNMGLRKTEWAGTPAEVHCGDVIMGAMASQIIGVLIVYRTVCSGADQWKHQSIGVTGLCDGYSPVNSTHKRPVTRKKYFSNWQLFIHFNIWVQLVLNYHIYAVVILMVISKWKPPQLINSSQLQKDFLRGGDFIIISVDVSLTPQAATLMAWGPFYQHSPPPPDKMATVSQTIF